MATQFGVPASQADWYYCAVVDVAGETDYVDGYASGDEPTEAKLQDYSRCLHSWVAGCMYVHAEEAEDVDAIRPVTCERCDRSYRDRDADPLTILRWDVEPTSHGRYGA